MGLLLGIDQGTSGSRALLLNEEGMVRGYGYRPLSAVYPHAGWVEQDPAAVTATVAEAITEAVDDAGCHPREIDACGIACQRNSDFVWESGGGRALAPAITWQDMRTTPLVEEMAGHFAPAEQKRRLGHRPGAFSSALHLAWRLREQPAVREAARRERLRFGFSAGWLLRALGEPAGYAMDLTMAQAAGLYDLQAGGYWDAWIARLGIPPASLPAPVPTLHHFGTLRVTDRRGRSADVPVEALIGDQQAALFGFDCRRPGEAECTHGTASFVNVCLGAHRPDKTPLNLYYAWALGRRPTFCLEARTAGTGSVIRWLREELRLVDRAADLGPLAATVPDSGGVSFVPAFSGLYDPGNDRTARGLLIGLTHATSRAHIARAFCESLACQVEEILQVIEATAGLQIATLKMGGGVSRSDEICQIQADLLQRPVERIAFGETTARAAALLAGLGNGQWNDWVELPPLPAAGTTFRPRLAAAEAATRRARWAEAARRAGGWADL